MDKKNIAVCSVICGIAVAGLAAFYIVNYKTENKIPPEQKINIKTVKNNPPEEKRQVAAAISQKAKSSPMAIVKRANLYGENSLVPLSAIAEIVSMPESIQKKINEYIENANLYYLKQNSGGVFMIIGNSGNEKYPRHDIQFVEISSNGQETLTPVGNADDDSTGEWELDEKSGLPLKHIHHNSEGEIEYTEVWNYSPDEPVKYEMKTGDGKVLSIKKETFENAANIRVEHLIYDKDGNTKLNVSASYEGPDIMRFTYYSADKPNESVTLMSEYTDGLKTKETVYSSDYKVKNTYSAEYKDGERIKIKVSDSEKKDIEEILSAE